MKKNFDVKFKEHSFWLTQDFTLYLILMQNNVKASRFSNLFCMLKPRKTVVTALPAYKGLLNGAAHMIWISPKEATDAFRNCLHRMNARVVAHSAVQNT